MYHTSISMGYEPKLLYGHRFDYSEFMECCDIVDRDFNVVYATIRIPNTLDYRAAYVTDKRKYIVFYTESYKPYTLVCFGI